jgi:hypothetical protein
MANKPFFLKYELDTELLLGRNLPPEYAKPKLIELIYAWLGGIRALFSVLNTSQSDIKGYLKHNSQTIVLEKLLNDTFDTTGDERIRIEGFKYQVRYANTIADSFKTKVGYYDAVTDLSSVGYFGNSIVFVTVYIPSDLVGIDNAVLQIIKDYVFFGTKTIKI